MKNFFIIGCALLPLTIQAATQFWDPDGSTAGTSVSGNWDTTTANWTVTTDSGVNTPWAQGNDATFGIAADYAVTLTEPISVGSITVSGAAGTLTLAGSLVNTLNLAGPCTLTTGGRNINISAPITGAFSVTRVGAGTVSLSGASTYSAGTTLSAGTTSLGVDSVYSGGNIVSGPFGTGPVNVTAAVTISPSGARVLDNPITLGAGLTIGGSAPLTFTNGNLTISGGNRTVTISDTADVTIAGLLADDGTARTFTKAGTGRLIMLTGDSPYLGGITASAGTLVAGNNVPFPTNNNNTVTINGSTLTLNGFDVRLSRLSGNAAGSVLLGTNKLTIVNNGAGGTEFSGVISGSGGLVKLGGISQVLSGTNTFTGGITVSEGALYLPTNGASGSSISLAAGPNIITFTGTGRLGANRSTGTTIITNQLILNTVGPAAALDPANGNTVIYTGPVSGSGGFLRYSQGSGFPVLAGNNTSTGGVEVDARSLGIGHNNAFGSGPFIIGHPINPPSSGILFIPVVDRSGPDALTNLTTINQTFTILVTNGFGFELSGAIALSNAVTIATLGDSLIKFSGNISGPGGFTLTGTNSLVLTGSNTYEGLTLLAAPLLVNNTAGSATGTNAINVGPGGSLGGNGRIDGAVTVSSGGLLSPGNSIGQLTISNALSLSSCITLMEIDAAGHTNDAVVGLSSVGYGGTLIVTNLGGTLAAGDSFRLFSAASYGGAFDSIQLPALTGSLTWNTNNLAVDGTISVSGGGPTINSIARIGSNLSISGSGGIAFSNYYVLASTNVLLPLANWSPIATNQFDGSGDFAFTTPIDPAVPTRFYILQLP